jgi:hypothetical protein
MSQLEKAVVLVYFLAEEIIGRSLTYSLFILDSEIVIVIPPRTRAQDKTN